MALLNIKQYMYSTSESRTRFGFRIHSYASLDNLIAGPFENRTKKSGFQMVTSLDRFINRKGHKKYFIHDKTV
jgi:hypothetical protein